MKDLDTWLHDQTLRHIRREFTVTLPSGHHDIDDDDPDTRGYAFTVEDQIPESASFWNEEDEWTEERIHLTDAEVAHADELVPLLTGMDDLEARIAFLRRFFLRKTGIAALDDCGCDACHRDLRHPVDCVCELCDLNVMRAEEDAEAELTYGFLLNGKPATIVDLARFGPTAPTADTTDDDPHDDTDLGPIRVSGGKLAVMNVMGLHEKGPGELQRLSQAKTSSFKQGHRRRPAVDLPMLASATDL